MIAGAYVVLFALAALLLVLLAVREHLARSVTEFETGCARTTGKRETQADICFASASRSGYLMVVADGMGAEHRATKSSEIASGIFEEQYTYYGNESGINTALFFRNAFSLADRRVKHYLAGERGGVSLSAAVVIGDHLLCAHCGNTRLAVLRKGCLAPLYEGHTVRAFAEKLYLTGGLAREDAVAHLYDKRVYRCIGSETFEPEICSPVQLQKGDRIILMTDGVFSALGLQKIAELLSEKRSAAVLAQRIVSACETAVCEDNAAVVVAKV